MWIPFISLFVDANFESSLTRCDRCEKWEHNSHLEALSFPPCALVSLSDDHWGSRTEIVEADTCKGLRRFFLCFIGDPGCCLLLFHCLHIWFLRIYFGFYEIPHFMTLLYCVHLASSQLNIFMFSPLIYRIIVISTAWDRTNMPRCLKGLFRIFCCFATLFHYSVFSAVFFEAVPLSRLHWYVVWVS